MKEKENTIDKLKAYIFTLLMPIFSILLLMLSELETRELKGGGDCPSYRITALYYFLAILVLFFYIKYLKNYFGKFKQKKKSALFLCTLCNLIFYAFLCYITFCPLYIGFFNLIFWPISLPFNLVYFLSWLWLLIKASKIIFFTEYGSIIIGVVLAILILILEYVFN